MHISKTGTQNNKLRVDTTIPLFLYMEIGYNTKEVVVRSHQWEVMRFTAYSHVMPNMRQLEIFQNHVTIGLEQ
jgi:hypothetical protein